MVSVPHVFATTPATPPPAASQLDDNFNALIAGINAIVIPTASTPRSYLAGMTLSNDSVTPNSIIDISAGQATDSTNAFTITLASPVTKTTGGVWLAGNGNGGMGTGLTIAASTWYHVHAITNAGIGDIYFDTSVTAANKPSNTSAFRRVGSFRTDGSKNIVAFVQNGDYFFQSPVTDYNSTAAFPSAVNTFTVPLGVVVQPLLSLQFQQGSAGDTQISLSTGMNAALAFFAAEVNLAGQFCNNAVVGPPTNTTQQIYLTVNIISGSVGVGVIRTNGWIDLRGRLS